MKPFTRSNPSGTSVIFLTINLRIIATMPKKSSFKKQKQEDDIANCH